MILENYNNKSRITINLSKLTVYKKVTSSISSCIIADTDKKKNMTFIINF